MKRACEVCGGTLVKNGDVIAVHGKRRQFYRCTGECRLGGWVNVGPDGRGSESNGPVFDGLRGISGALILGDAVEIARKRAAPASGGE